MSYSIKKLLKRLSLGFELDEYNNLNKCAFLKSDNPNKRINIVIGTIDKRKMYGGLTTALKFFNHIRDAYNCDSRIVVLEYPVSQDMVMQYDGFSLCSSIDDSDLKNQIVDLTMHNGHRDKLSVREKDIFIVTYWTTAYVFSDVVNCQLEMFGACFPLLYLIQDFEPGFYKWGSDYMLVDSTYKIDNTYAIFNSSYLYHYFSRLGYRFAEQVYFEPRLNSSLREVLFSQKNQINKRKRQVIIYGRPKIGRNCFSIIIAALKKLVNKHPESEDWFFYSIGSVHKDISLSKKSRLKCLGKLSLDEYSRIMLESKVGVSLMCSPHPSYPPLEMSTFGVKTITNTFLCKDLETFNNNIFSLEKLDIDSLADAIWDCMNMDDGTVDLKSDYVFDKDQFNSITELLVSKLHNW